MSHTYTSLQYHTVFSTHQRRPFLTEDIRGRVHAYIGGIIRNIGGEPLCINGPEDHVHILCSLRADTSISAAMRTVKANSSKWIHEAMPSMASFAWQEGYGAFTVSRLKVPAVAQYIQDQIPHHKKKSFQEEFLNLLQRHGIAFDTAHVWD